MNDHLSRFQALLGEIFQFDFADLDTGIYRLFRLREKELRRFIEKTLPGEVDAAFGADTTGQRQQAQEKLDELADKIRDELADDAVQPDGDLAGEYKKTKLGKQYLAARKALDDISANESDRDEVFNHLYAFFSRYYEDADFIPKRRYSRRPDTYAVPYSGEEVMFHWATRGMHYIKTGEHFRDYRFKVDTLEGACTVHFQLTEADTPKDNTKGDRRWFFPLPKGIEWDDATRTLVLPFHYRLPTEKEAAEHGKNSKAQRSILEAAVKKVLDKAAKEAPFLQAKLAEADAEGEDSYLLRRMGHFARRHSADYFIYPELRAFLQRELEFYIKDQMLHLDDLEGALDARLRLIRVVSAIAEKIIEFLDDIEQLQNRLFEKPKFLLSTDWLLHIRHVPEKLWPEILKNKAQKAAWRELFSTPAKVDKKFLKTHPTLVLDTRHFDVDFKRRLLEQLPFENIEEATDGLLIHSENWQALNLLQHKYAGKVKCIYIDPPYNRGDDEFIYKDRYQHASWCSMLDGRLQRAKDYLEETGVIILSIDDNEQPNLRRLADKVFGKKNFIAQLTWEKTRKNDAKLFSIGHDYLLIYAKSLETLKQKGTMWREAKPGAAEILVEYKRLRELYGDDSNAIEQDLRTWYKSLPKTHPSRKLSRYKHVDKDGPWRDRDISWPGGSGPRYDVIHPSTHKPCKVPERGWGFATPEEMQRQIDRGLIVFREDHTDPPFRKAHLLPVAEELEASVEEESEEEVGLQVMPSVIYKQSQVSVKLLRHILGKKLFDNPKDHEVLARLVKYVSGKNDIVFDFFGGSGSTGHAAITLRRDYATGQKFIMDEMGAHFQTILMPRIQKILYTPDWKDGRPKEEPVFDDLLADTALPDWVERSPRLVKVLRLESYEDSLQNLISQEEAKPGKDTPETSLRYLFERAGEGAATLLNVEQLEHPLDYRLDVLGEDGPQARTVDLVETANLLLGLNVVKYETWTAPDQRDYLAVHAQKDGRSLLVLWRDMADLDIEAERKFLAPKIKGFDEVRINGDSAVPGIRAIDLELARAMGAA